MIMLLSAVRIFLCTRATTCAKASTVLPGSFRSASAGPLDRPSLSLPQPPQGSAEDLLL